MMAERLMNMVRSLGSVLVIWPTPPKVKEVSPHDAAEMVRQSWEEVGQAITDAMGGIGIDAEAEEAETTSPAGQGGLRSETGAAQPLLAPTRIGSGVAPTGRPLRHEPGGPHSHTVHMVVWLSVRGGVLGEHGFGCWSARGVLLPHMGNTGAWSAGADGSRREEGYGPVGTDRRDDRPAFGPHGLTAADPLLVPVNETSSLNWS